MGFAHGRVCSKCLARAAMRAALRGPTPLSMPAGTPKRAHRGQWPHTFGRGLLSGGAGGRACGGAAPGHLFGEGSALPLAAMLRMAEAAGQSAATQNMALSVVMHGSCYNKKRPRTARGAEQTSARLVWVASNTFGGLERIRAGFGQFHNGFRTNSSAVNGHGVRA